MIFDNEHIAVISMEVMSVFDEKNGNICLFDGMIDTDYVLEGGVDGTKHFEMSVEVGTKEMELSFDDFSNEIILPMVSMIIEKVKKLNGKYNCVMLKSDPNKLQTTSQYNDSCIRVTYNTEKNIFSIDIMLVEVAPKKISVFLGGTCNNSMWREALIPKLVEVNYYNPVVPDWTPECMAEEIRQRELCDYCLYVITPRMTGVYSIAEAVDDSNKRPGKCIFCIVEFDIDPDDDKAQITFAEHQMKSLVQVGKMVERNGARAFSSLMDVAKFLNDEATNCQS